MAHDPVTASELGDRRWNDKWQDLSLDALHEQFQHAREMLTHLHAIDRAQLSPEDQVSYDVFEYNTNDYLAGRTVQVVSGRTDTFEGIQTVEGTVDSLRFETVKDYDDWLGRMHNFPAYMDQNIGLMREGIKEHIVLPKVIGEKVLTQLNGMDWQDPDQTRILQTVQKMPPSFSEADKQRLTAAAQQNIKNDVLPAFQRFRDFMQKDYVAGIVRAGGRLAGPQWRRHLRLSGAIENHNRPHSRTDPRNWIAGSKTHWRGDGQGQRAIRIQGNEPGILSLPAHRSALLCEERGRTCCNTPGPAPRKSIRCW